MHNEVDVLEEASALLIADDAEGAARLIGERYRLQGGPPKREFTDADAAGVFFDDGFVDRYSGNRLVNPAALRLFSALIPRVFPYHPHWKSGKAHQAYWQLRPTVDHVVPLARGGPDSRENWVTTSMLRNQAKGAALLSEIEWRLFPAGDLSRWDGLTSWVLSYLEKDPILSALPAESKNHRTYILKWARLSRRVRARPIGEPEAGS